jgi:hypothetical protein
VAGELRIRAWLIAVCLSACATGGEGDTASFGALTFGGEEYGTTLHTMPNDLPTDDGGKTGPPDLTGESGDPGSGEVESTGEPDPPDASTTSGVAGESSTSGAPEVMDDDAEPVGLPMYTPCDEPSDCADGICARVVINDDEGVLVSYYCTGLCDQPWQDCDDPLGSTADPVCIHSEDEWGNSNFICALDCGNGGSCPGAMDCHDLDIGMLCF